jgi:hypothetical protein
MRLIRDYARQVNPTENYPTKVTTSVYFCLRVIDPRFICAHLTLAFFIDGNLKREFSALVISKNIDLPVILFRIGEVYICCVSISECDGVAVRLGEEIIFSFVFNFRFGDVRSTRV